jgi:hypothetical protein
MNTANIVKADFYQAKVNEFVAVIKEGLKDGGTYEFSFCGEEKHLFDSSRITRADVLATIFEDAETAHAFADTYHTSIVRREFLQDAIFTKAVNLIASQYAVDEAQAYCALEEAA